MAVKTKLASASRSDMLSLLPTDLVIIGLDTDDGPTHPLYDVRITLPLVPQQVEGVKCHGILQPVVVRKNGDKFEVVAGRQRVRNARKANEQLKAEERPLVKVPIMLRKGSDANMETLGVVENEHRRELSLLERANRVQAYLDRGYDLDDASMAFAVPALKLKQWLRLLDLDASVQERIEAGDISFNAALQLVDLPREEQAKLVDGLTSDGERPTIERIKKRKSNGETQSGSRPPSRGTLKRVYTSLTDDQSTDISPDALAVLRWVATGEGVDKIPLALARAIAVLKVAT